MTQSVATSLQSVPDAEPTFDSLPLGGEVKRALAEMGFARPTPVQLATYAPAIEHRDMIVQARTGTGKTAAFGIPIVDRLVQVEGGVQALVLAPTRELALQSAREVERIAKYKGLKTSAVYGGAPMERQVRELKQGAQIVSGTPGRVLDHLRRGTLRPDALKVLVLDEADEMLSMGFAKELNAIIELLPKTRQTMLFSATVDKEVQRVAQRHMREPQFITLSSDQVGATSISHFVYFVSGRGRAQDLVRLLEVENPESAIIFCNMKTETESVATALQQAGFNADWLNGDLPQSDREKVMRRTREGNLRYLVATDVAARGIDISHITHVINYTFPDSIEVYIHRTGRTGRVGRTGTAISLISPQELSGLYYLRLQYKIFPIERSLPNEGEARTRIEADRVALLEDAFRGPRAPKLDETDRAIARRLLTHVDAERLIAGLMHMFFGSKGEPAEVDEQAAAARRMRGAISPEAPFTHSQSTPLPDLDATVEEQRVEPRGGDGDDDDQAAPPDDGKTTTLYLNVGKRDGARAGEISRLFRERGEIPRGELGRIRIRDKHTFVEVPTERLDELLGKLKGATLLDRELVLEPAKPKK